MFIATGYFNTGFDIINVPDSPTLLRNSASRYTSYPALDILNKRFLSSIKIKINPLQSDSQLDGLDYIELKEENEAGNGVFYYVSSYSLTSKDVAVLNLVQDSLLTAGGASVLLQVHAKRCHVPVAEDKFGAFDADDEMITPKEPLMLVHSGQYTEFGGVAGIGNVGYHDGRAGTFFNFFPVDNPGGTEQDTVIVTTCGLAFTSDPTQYISYSAFGGTFGGWGITADEPATDLRYPKLQEARGIRVEMPNILRDVNSMAAYSPNVMTESARRIDLKGIEYNILGITNYQNAAEALDVLRSLGMEQSVIACYRLRAGEGKLWHNSDLGEGSFPNELLGRSYLYSTNGWLTQSDAWTGESTNNSSRIQPNSQAYDYDYLPQKSSSQYNISNMRVLYGEFRKYVLASPATGSSITAKPEELTGLRFVYDSDKKGKHGSPYICCFTDPRPTGRPYFNFLKFGQSSKYYAPSGSGTNPSVINMAEGAIAGGQWPEVPLVFTGMAGELTAKIGYNLDASYKDYQANPAKTYRDLVSGSMMAMDQSTELASSQGVYNMVSGALSSGVSGLMYGGPVGAASGLAAGTVSGGVGIASQMANAQNQYNAQLSAAGMDMLYGMSSDLKSAANAGSISANRALERQYAAAYEKAKFDLSMSYSVPRANFMSTDSMRDITDNCVFYARYTPTQTDLQRMDGILSAFGYKVDQIMRNPAANRSKFVYIEGSVEKFAEFNCPGKKEIMLDINNQLANGVRIWHINPHNASIYDPGV